MLLVVWLGLVLASICGPSEASDVHQSTMANATVPALRRCETQWIFNEDEEHDFDIF